MKRLIWLAACAPILVIAGCQRGAASHATNVRIVRSINDRAIQNAIVTQQTLYSYHFVTNSAALNELGECELAVLAGHYREHPGTLKLRRGNTPEELYEARIQTVMDALARAGVDTGRIQIEEGMPGGDGMPSEQVLAITTGRNSPSRPLYYGGGGGGGSINSGMNGQTGVGFSGGQTQ